jgi:hypothetical protein
VREAGTVAAAPAAAAPVAAAAAGVALDLRGRPPQAGGDLVGLDLDHRPLVALGVSQLRLLSGR